MAKYLWGILSDVMMRETAGIQGCFDYKDEEDAIKHYYDQMIRKKEHGGKYNEKFLDFQAVESEFENDEE